MRLQKKYKKFSKLKFIFNNIPTKLLKFHRTKWKTIQKQIIKTQLKSKKSIHTNKSLLFTKRWLFYRLKYKTGTQLKKYFDCLYDNSFSNKALKSFKFLNKNKTRNKENSIYISLPQFRIDVFLWKLNIFSSCYEARNAINNKNIKVNFESIHPNYFLNKGDIINVNSTLHYTNSLLKKNLSKISLKDVFLTYIEIDYYTNTIIVLKDYKTLLEQDIRLSTKNFFTIRNLKTFIE